MDTAFIGTYHHLVDEKNRLFLPAKVRKNISKFIVTSGIDSCIYIYTADTWSQLVKKFDNLSVKNKSEERAFKRMFLSNATEVETDRQGRIVIPQVLKKQARIQKEIVIIGVWNRLEVWPKKLWGEYYNSSRKVFRKLTNELEI